MSCSSTSTTTATPGTPSVKSSSNKHSAAGTRISWSRSPPPIRCRSCPRAGTRSSTRPRSTTCSGSKTSNASSSPGQVTEQCILYSALDGYLRGYELVVAPDAVAHIHDDLAQAALEMMERNMHANLRPAADIF